VALISRRGSNAAFDGGKDQYFTPSITAEWAVEQTLLAIGKVPDFVVEPSSGAGAFVDACRPMGVPIKAFDIDPRSEGASKVDWLSVHPDEFRGALVLGNPPYGHFGNGALRFINHAAKSASFIAFILPELFDRTTMKRRISLDFYLKLSISVPFDEYLGPNGEVYKHKRILQVWARSSTPRVLDPLPGGLPWVEHLPGPEGADAFVVRNGSRAGTVLVEGPHSIGFAWPMRLLRDDSLSRLLALEPEMRALAKTGTSVPNMPKVEINVFLAKGASK
jgi:hypothetical protein